MNGIGESPVLISMPGADAQDRSPYRARLFCIPYAGGGASIFRAWQSEMLAGIQVCPVRLPGREDRFGESPFRRLHPLVDAICKSLTPLLDLPFAIFGHSMGALVAFELARRLRREGREPIHLIVSGLLPPQVPDPNRGLYNLPDSELIASLKALNGMPDELASQPEFLKLILPVLRADFELCETYTYVERPPLDCRISAYAGRKDYRSPAEGMVAWSAHTTGEFSVRIFAGDHFFVDTSQRAVSTAVAVELSGTLMNLVSKPGQRTGEPIP